MKYTLRELIDVKQFQMLQDRLNEIYSFPSAIIDIEGNILTATAWQDVCTQFHRKNPECEKECIKSDQYILDHLHEAKPAVSYRCPHGLVDNATPIIIDGEHLGNFFTGQFFLEKPDLDFFRNQAGKYGFNEEAYLEAVRKVPIWNQEQLNSYLFFIKGLIEVITNIGLKNLKEIENRKNLEESEECYRVLFERSGDYSLVLDIGPDYIPILVDMNDAALKAHGYAREEIIGKPISIIDPTVSPEISAERVRLLEKFPGQMFNVQHRRKDGTCFIAEVNAKTVQIGGRSLVLSVERDITERKRAEDNLLYFNNLMQYIISHTRSAIAVHDRDLKYIFVSQRYLDEYKVKEQNIIGKHHYEVFPDLPQKWRDVHQKALAGEICSAEEDPFVREDGSVDWTSWECRPWFESDGSIGGIIVYTEVITKRKQAENALRDSESQFRSYVENAPIGVFICDEMGRYLQVNPAATAITGYSTDELLKLSIADLLSPESQEAAFRHFQTVVQTGRSSGEFVLRRKNGSLGYWSVEAVRLSPTRFLGFVTDITERKQAEEEREKILTQLAQIQKMESVGSLAGGVAHDFNNMLGVILGHTDMAMEQVNPTQPLYADLQAIHVAAERSANLTRQLLAFARRQTVAPKVLDLNDTVESMLKMLRRLIGEDIELAWIPGETLWLVNIDPSQIDQILANLCVNARDAINGVGKVTIKTKNVVVDEARCAKHSGLIPGEYILLAVSDNGCGMDKELLVRIFEPFYTTKELGKGTGLGLATVYGIVKQNNGFIDVSSKLGKGTAFTIYLPRHFKETAEKKMESITETLQSQGETILLVEDEPTILHIGKKMLEKLKYRVLAVGTPSDAIELAHKHNGEIHLLITDVIMPDMNGQDLANKLLTILPELKCLFMSGYTADIISRHGVLDEGVFFIHKPFSMKDLSSKIRAVLDQK